MKNKLLASCKKVAFLIEKNLNSSLTGKEKIQLIIHTKMCKACAKYQSHSEDLHKDLENSNRQSKEKLSLDFKTKLIEKLKTNNNL